MSSETIFFHNRSDKYKFKKINLLPKKILILEHEQDGFNGTIRQCYKERIRACAIEGTVFNSLIMKMLLLILLIFISSFSFAQQGLNEISLEISGIKRKPNYTRIDLFIKDDSTAIIEIRTKPLTKEILIQKLNADVSYNVSIEQFNKVAEMFSNLSIEQLINGMNPKSPSLRSEPTGFTLTIRVMQESIILEMVEPANNTKERNFEPFLAICEEILLLAKMKPKDYF